MRIKTAHRKFTKIRRRQGWPVSCRLSRMWRPLLLTFRIEALEVAEIAHHFGAAIHPERLSFFGLEQFEMLQHDASREEDFELAGRKIEIHLDHFVGLRTLVIAKEDFVMLSPDLRGARIDPIDRKSVV